MRCQNAILAAVCALICFGVYSCATSKEYKNEQAARAEQERLEQIPHVIREADGCKVYAFKSGERYHYFTRCHGSKTTTDSPWEDCEGVGKQRKCKTKIETIENL